MSDDEITLIKLHDRLKKVEMQLPTLQTAIDDNTRVTRESTEKSNELLGLFNELKGAFASFERLAKLMKPIGYVAAAVAAILGMVTAWKTGKFGE